MISSFIIVLALSASAVAVDDGVCFFHPDTAKVMTGGPIDDVSQPSIADCETACAANLACLSINYDIVTQECLLYDVNSITAPAMFLPKTAAEGNKSFREKLPSCSTGTCYNPPADTSMIATGGIIDETTAATITDCETACSGNEQCRSLVYIPGNQECLLYETDPALNVPGTQKPVESPADDGKMYLIRAACPTTTTTVATTTVITTPGTTTTTTPVVGAGIVCGSTPVESFGPTMANMVLPDADLGALQFDVASVDDCMASCIAQSIFLCKSMSYDATNMECSEYTANSAGTRRIARALEPAPAGDTTDFRDRLYPCPDTTTTVLTTTTTTTPATTTTAATTTSAAITTEPATTTTPAVTTATDAATTVATTIATTASETATTVSTGTSTVAASTAAVSTAVASTSVATTAVPPTTSAAAVIAPVAAVCIDVYHQCAYWGLHMQCMTNPEFMFVYCKSSCGLCPRKPGVPTPAEMLQWALAKKVAGMSPPPPTGSPPIHGGGTSPGGSGNGVGPGYGGSIVTKGPTKPDQQYRRISRVH